jgi:hypothetical protein
MGYYLPWAFGGSIIMAIGNGLVSTFKAATTTGEWIGFQIVMGIGRGAGLQMVYPPSIQPIVEEHKTDY